MYPTKCAEYSLFDPLKYTCIYAHGKITANLIQLFHMYAVVYISENWGPGRWGSHKEVHVTLLELRIVIIFFLRNNNLFLQDNDLFFAE